MILTKTPNIKRILKWKHLKKDALSPYSLLKMYLGSLSMFFIACQIILQNKINNIKRTTKKQL